MEFQQYTSEHRTKCVEVFDSNIGKYFDLSEREEFIAFLDSLNESGDYYVYVKDNRVLACGGIGVNSTVASLDWGVVHRDLHGQGLGTNLTDFRLVRLKANSAIDVVKIETSQHTEGFYKKRGFMTTKVVKNGFGEGIDCVSMEYRVAL
ncbi:GNAT family N-acetyltransferase [Pseudoalteromonas denitrificans]|uniref:Acetyltransferase (GNAT) domain-containing protein n=1 Tax=Pseudoalteromonas denitrificans DSM 6059 TaxID=1123010 RepID=A0A1I1UIU7_9GAMM|nr:GNAT family N-acetyltransferase [Pseudoalteromonas denitrificans]SFD70751.1 Acetyltransferase (GNAT) domain-containing protein [Pseudoalteromonas denitrificans DSM 6059]